MKKRLLSCILALATAASLVTGAMAAVPPESEMAQVLAALDIMGGYPDGQLRLSQSVTRAEFTKMTIAASPMGENVGDTTTVSPYPDVPSSHWAASYVEAAVAAGLVNGFLDGTFHPNDTIKLSEGVTMVVRLLGYRDTDFSGTWPSGQMALYHSLDLDEGITTSAGASMTRRDAMCLFYNLLTAPTKEGRPYLSTLGKPMTPAGEIDRVALINGAMDGPVVMIPGWESKVGFDLNGAVTVYRAGKLSSLAAMQSNDLIYYSASMRTLWGYTGKVSGQLQALSPSAANPTAVTVAGRTYPIETADAAYALSNLGSYQTGDTVTLLLGRGGGVAAVADSSRIGTVYGVVRTVTNSSYTDGSGNPYTAESVVITATDGSSYTYPIKDNLSLDEGDLVRVSASGADTEVRRLSSSSVSGRFSADGTRLGNTPLADDVEILDSNSEGIALRVYPSRMAGIVLNEDDVRFYHKNTSGELDRLILDDVTGDLYSYGILTDMENTHDGMLLNGRYQYDIGGRPYLYILHNGNWNVEDGPIRIKGEPSTPTSMSVLEKTELTSLDPFTATTRKGETFPVSANAAVYEYTNGEYRFSSLERVRTGYTLTGCYDREAKDGGTIRVILARPLSH